VVEENVRILIVDDERTNITALGSILSKDYKVSVALDGQQAIDFIEHTDVLPDLILLDIIMPKLDGYQVCHLLKKNPDYQHIPIIFISSLSKASEKVAGFSAGAVDFICKPFDDIEVKARVKNHLTIKKKYHQLLDSHDKLSDVNQQLKYQSAQIRDKISPKHDLSINEDTKRVTYYKQELELTNLEFRLFQLLYNHPERIYSRTQILDLAYPDIRNVSDRTIDAHVKNIRNKIKSLGISEAVLESVYGAGYRYVAPVG